jgi:acetyltransferase-like isoleucine patch superfamily enzyme
VTRYLERVLSRIGVSLASRLAKSETFGELIRETLAGSYYVFGGPQSRVEIGPGVVLNDALLNVSSGRITIGEFAFFGHGVSLLTGTHDITQTGLARQRAIPAEGRDIHVGPGAWISSNATVLGPCVIGDDAVVAAGAVVTRDVPRGAIVAGVPAEVVGSSKAA